MRKKLFLGSMAVMCMSMMLAGCGKKEDKETTTGTTTEATSEADNDDNNTADADIAKYITYNVDAAKIEADAINEEYQWELFSYDSPDVKVETKEDGSHIIYTITPVNKTDAPIFVDIFGTGASDKIFVSFEISINEAKEMECNVTKEIIPIYEDDTPAGEEVDADLNEITQNVLNGFAADDAPSSLTTNMMDKNDKELMMYNLGVESLEGVESIAITEPMMSSVAFSLVVLRFDTADNATASVDVLKEKAPVEKWVCVTPETVKVRTINDKYVIFLMGTNSQAAAVDSVQ